MIKLFQLLKLCVVLLIGGHCNAQDYQLVWSDEFNKDGCLDESIWNYEQGYARNEELQWYQSDNAWCQGGLLVIEARSEKRKKFLRYDMTPFLSYPTRCLALQNLLLQTYLSLNNRHYHLIPPDKLH